MPLTYGCFKELSHQLRFLLFEIGIGLRQQQIDYYISLAHKECLHTVQQLAIQEGFINKPIISQHIHDCLKQLQKELQNSYPASRFFTWNTLYYHCNEVIANRALAYAYKEFWNSRLAATLYPYSSLWAWLQEQTTNDALQFLEQWGCATPNLETSWKKTKPYTRREVLQYSAEFQAQFSLHWGAVHKSQIVASADYSQLMKEEFAQEYAAWQEKLSAQHVHANNYYPVPLHPWLWRNTKASYASLLDNKSLILLPHHQKVIPTMSANTVMPLQAKAHLKLASLSASGKNTLYACLDQEQHYQGSLFLMEQSTLSLATSDSITQETEVFAAHLLTNPCSLVCSKHKIIPLLSLFTFFKHSNTHLIDEFIKVSTLAPFIYFSRYCRMIMAAPLHLLLKHGVTFTAAMDDLLLIFKQHELQGVILRDVQQVVLQKQKQCNEHHAIGAINNLLHNMIYPWVEHLTTYYRFTAEFLWAQAQQLLDNALIELEKNYPQQFLPHYKKLWLLDRKQQILSRYLTTNSPWICLYSIHPMYQVTEITVLYKLL